MRIFFRRRSKPKPETVSSKTTRGFQGFFLAAKCVPLRNSNAHFLQRELTKKQTVLPPKTKTQNPVVFFSGETCTESNFKFDFFFRGRKKRKTNPETVSPPKKNKVPGGFFRVNMSTKSQSKLAFSPEGATKNPKTVPPKKYARLPVFFLGGEMCTRSKFKCDCLPGGPKKKTESGIATKKERRGTRRFFSGNSNTHFLQMSLKRNPKTISPKKNAQAPGVFLRRNVCQGAIQICISFKGR